MLLSNLDWPTILTPAFKILLSMAPYLLMAYLFILLIKYIAKSLGNTTSGRSNKIQKLSWNVDWINDRELTKKLSYLTPHEFELLIADLFSKLGYKTTVVGGSHDGGIDVIAEKDEIKHLIQCKKFNKWEVGVGAVRDFYGAIVDHLANAKGYFITTNKFTLEAERFAEDKEIELIDGLELVRLINSAYKEGFNFENVHSDDADTCPNCGSKLVMRNGKFGEFYGCINYPKCKFTRNLNEE